MSLPGKPFVPTPANLKRKILLKVLGFILVLIFDGEAGPIRALADELIPLIHIPIHDYAKLADVTRTRFKLV